MPDQRDRAARRPMVARATTMAMRPASARRSRRREGVAGFRGLRLAMTGKSSDPERRRGTRAARIGRGGSVVCGRSLPVSQPRFAHDRFRRRVSHAAPPPPELRPDEFSALRASPPREDATAQDRLREPRELARLSRPRRAASAGLLSRKNSAVTSSAASSALDSHALSARAAARGLSWPCPARDGACVRPAMAGTWHRPRPTSSITSSHRCPCSRG